MCTCTDCTNSHQFSSSFAVSSIPHSYLIVLVRFFTVFRQDQWVTSTLIQLKIGDHLQERQEEPWDWRDQSWTNDVKPVGTCKKRLVPCRDLSIYFVYIVLELTSLFGWSCGGNFMMLSLSLSSTLLPLPFLLLVVKQFV